VVEGARLESEYGSKAHRGFESLRLRQTLDFSGLSRTKINSLKLRVFKNFTEIYVRDRPRETVASHGLFYGKFYGLIRFD
jgi:hypothetical protein